MNKYTSTLVDLINNTIYFLVLLLIFLTPLIFTSNTNELYEFPKMFFVYILTATVIFLFIVKNLVRSVSLKFPPIYITIFVISYIVSTIFSSHIYTSVWGYYTRFNGGLVSILILFGLYIVILNLFSTADFKNIFYVLSLTPLPIGVYSIYQHFQGIQRVYSTFGQPNWLAAYMVMVLPLVFDCYLRNKREFIRDIIFFSSFIIGFASLWFSSSISGLLGFIGCFVLYFFLNLSLVKVAKGKVGVVSIICLIIIFSSPSFILKRAGDVLYDTKNIISRGKIPEFSLEMRAFVLTREKEETSDFSPKSLISENNRVYAQTVPVKRSVSDPGVIRFGMWRGTVSLVFSSPKIFLIGSGPETFPYVFQKFRETSLNYSSEWSYILNKPHNYYLEIFSEKGIIGLLIYLYLIIYTLRLKNPLLAPSLVGFYITNIFGWPTVSTALVFWIMLAYLNSSDGK